MSDSKDAKAAAKVELSGRTVTLVSQDGIKIEVAEEVGKVSELVKTMIGQEADNDGDSDTGSSADDETEIPLVNVNGKILGKVIEFCKHHLNNPMKTIDKPLKSAEMSEVVDKWDADFVSEEKGVTQEVLFELILAANYLDIKDLLDLTCAKVASMIKGKTPEQIRKTFNITEDFTPEEEAKVRKDNPWLEEA